VKKPSRQRAVIQSCRDASLRKGNVRLKKALRRAYGGERRAHLTFPRRGPSFMQAAASALSLGSLFADDAAMERMFGDSAGYHSPAFRANRERFPDTVGRIVALNGRV
jgi:hypothetical protein